MRPYLALVLAAGLTLPASAVRAQDAPAGRRPGRRMEMLFKDITLTPEQRAKVDSIQGHYRDQMPSFTPGSPPDSATRDKVRALFQRERDDIRAVLTPDQQKVYDKNVADMRGRRPGGT